MNNFLGIPIEGDITTSHRSNITQRPVEEFGPILQAVLEAVPDIKVTWKQYTPYFNDGDPCEFNVHDAGFSIPGVTDGTTDGWGREGYADSGDVQIAGGDETEWKTGLGYVPTGRVFPRHPAVDAIAELADAIAGGAFENALLDAFGDHAEVTVTKDKIDVEYYEHD